MDEIGSQLREARMRLRLDTAEVELRTKIRAKYLRAMENEEWDLLPGDVYVRSFLRTYADFLGLDSRALLDEFRRRYESPSDHEPPPIAPPGLDRRDRERRRGSGGVGVPPWAIVALVLVLVAGVLYLVGKNTGGQPSGSSAGVPHTTTTTQTTHHRARHHRTHHAPKVVRVPSTVTVSLTVSSTQGTFICLENAQGRQLVNGTFAAGQPIPTATAKKLLLTVESPSVTIKANGKTIPNTSTGSAVTLRILPTGHSVISSPTPNMACGL
ncbi:MAG TPA: helix-turn-helix transcriptional regulator [Solirubrobacteraceae bacterium]|nr:helix-turn-helix transcriptional regulator [Solirubrobacteraceae bacterium]